MSIERYPENDKHILEHWEKINKELKMNIN